MNAVLIVLPILTLLMFELGLTLRPIDFMMVVRRPRAVGVAMVGQLVLLPLIALLLWRVFGLDDALGAGLLLVACCPGGSSSNVFSMLAGGDVALSVSLTAISSVVTLFTLPLVMHAAVGGELQLPVGNLLVQNLLLVFLPLAIGFVVRLKARRAASRMERVLSKLAFPLLMLLAAIFFVQNSRVILDNLARLGLCVTLLVTLAAGIASLMARAARLDGRARRTIVIEVGMQNAAQAIAIATSPIIMHNNTAAVPAIVYSLVMNVVLLTYVGFIRYRHTPEHGPVSKA